MVFSSPIFLFIFLPLTLIFYFIITDKFKNFFLLSVSLFFYFWGEKAYTIVLLFSILFNYTFAFLIEKYNFRNNKKLAKTLLVSAIITNLLMLIVYKYAFFLDQFVSSLFGLDSVFIKQAIHLPIGISFFVFQAISYVVDVYKKDLRASKNLIDFAMYKAFFPQLIAGPIVRYKDVSSQVSNHPFNLNKFIAGIERFLIGLAKKILIANTVAKYADQIFSLPFAELAPSIAWLGIACYTLQIYFDFSGYSDMAIGMAKMFGFDFLENFNYPYVATCIRDFWRRWHLSLSNWFRDYLFIPLGGSRSTPAKNYFNLLLVFFLCGLWHGASWNFVVWGLWHGLFLVLERLGLSKVIEKFYLPIQHIYTIFVVMIGWIFFRSDNLYNSGKYLAVMFGFNNNHEFVYSTAKFMSLSLIIALIFGFIFSTPIYHYVKSKIKTFLLEYSDVPLVNLSQKVAAAMYISLLASFLILSAMALASETYNPFIYFRF